MTVIDMTFDDAPNETAAPRAYRAVERQTDRLSVIFFLPSADGAPDLSRPRVIGAKTQYHKAIGTVISRTGTTGADEELWSEFEPPRTRYATLVLRYPTNSEGRVSGDAAGIQILPWDFGEGTYKRLHDVSQQQRPSKMNLGSIDLYVRCSNTQKQHLEVAVAGPAIWRMKPDAQERLLLRARALYGCVRVGRDVADAELRDRLGLPVQQVAAEPEQEIDYDDLMNQV
ncbi:MAG TPA: hypothetical protein VGC79_25335 [Polyangiaceae bacterium]